jgi:hypothetical protein
MNDKPKIVWEKWYSPFGEDDVEEQQYLEGALNNSIEDENIDESSLLPEDKGMVLSKQLYNQKFMITPMGVMPITENTDSGKIFNFWIGHTNFDITHNIARTIEGCEGVESLDIFTRYRFRISIGKIFKEADVMHNINQQVYKDL